MKRVTFSIWLVLASLSIAPAAAAEPTRVVLATATPGGGFPLFGDSAAEVMNATDPTLRVETRSTLGSIENLKLLEARAVDIALVAGIPAYEAFAGIGRQRTSAKIVAAVYSSSGMFAVRRGSTVRSVKDLMGQPIAWGARLSGLTSLGGYVMEGLGLDREKDFEAIFLEQAGDGPAMVASGRAAAPWGGGTGWPGFTAITKAGGRLIGLSPEEVQRVVAKHRFLTPYTLPAGTYEGQTEPVTSVAVWSFIVARADLPDDTAYRLAKALHQGHDALVAKLPQAQETTAANTKAAASDPATIHPGVAKFLREIEAAR